MGADKLPSRKHLRLQNYDYTIMPNHIHLLLTLHETAGASPRPTISSVIGAYKSLTT